METDTELVFKVEVPRIEAKNLDIRVGEGMVSITGERKKEKHKLEIIEQLLKNVIIVSSI
ncbi:Hsp20/alpha crystallin family protein [Pleurocapsa sp. CCALA 161]|uniref:Hsp20/alpha crystallin family protein n=1 Tax=Pleurocapsa sp. CCALA 161 TaxID=2107688 RepID=UPI003517EE4B